ncbi:MAG: GIY-YIG nuclease family protein [Oligoflexia bacterium]|nr:GIY-YIG nuclease family protein [Oligoflexia bacterium]
MQGNYYVYILTNRHHTTLYTGVTNDLVRRIFEHRNGTLGKFSQKYNLKKLVYYEDYRQIELAIAREKQLKGGSRAKKVALITAQNPGWVDLWDRICKL